VHDPDDISSNPTDNPHLGDLIGARLSRRQVLGGGLAAAAAGFLGHGLLQAGIAGAAPSPTTRPRATTGRPTRLGFTEVPPSDADTVVVPDGYTCDVLVPWGTPLLAGSAPWAKDASNTATDQEGQVGFNHDGMHFFPLGAGRERNRRGLLVPEPRVRPAGHTASGRADARRRQADGGRGGTQGDRRPRRLGGRDPPGRTCWRLAGGPGALQPAHHGRDADGVHRASAPLPLAADALLAARHALPGTLNNCAHGVTPWGTYLTCEENFHGYFGTEDAAWTATRTPLEARYGVAAPNTRYGWHKAEPRFDLAENRNEVNRFGWVVEIDPFDPSSTPVKRTALGRIKHEGATVTEQNGRVVVYSGDDQNGDYLYKFVGSAPWRQLRAQGRSPLDEGTLYVARFAEDGTGTWLPLVHGTGPLTEANGFADQADVLIRTRMAADAVGATKLHRPEWVAVNERTGDRFVALTNGTGNGSAVNSDRDPNPYGHIVRFRESGNVHAPTAFTWDVLLVAGDPAYDETVPEGQAVFGSPDGLWVDPDGLVWIQTDISNSSQNRADRGYDNIGNNQMLVADPDSGELKRFLTGPRGCEITGVITTPDQTTMFVNVQHPGESTAAWNDPAPSPANPRTVSSWPDLDPEGRPRSATLAIRRADGGKIGS
jgi:uncharacterized protein